MGKVWTAFVSLWRNGVQQSWRLRHGSVKLTRDHVPLTPPLPSRVPQMIHRLIEADLPSTPPAEPRAARRSSFDRDLSQRSPSTPLVIAQLHPYSFNEVLATALYPEDEEAWLHGRQATPGASRRLLLLKASGIAVTGGFGLEQSSKDSTSGCWDDMYEEGRQWRRGFGELSEGGRSRGGQ